MSSGARLLGLSLGVAFGLAVFPFPVSAASPELTDGQLAGKRVIASFSGLEPPRPLLRQIRRGEVAGVILFGDNVENRSQARAVIQRLQLAARTSQPVELQAPLLTMLDQEGGLVRRLPGAPSRSQAQLGRIGTTAAAREAGRAAGKNICGVGANVNLAPVLGVGRPGGGFLSRFGRIYGDSPKHVARLARRRIYHRAPKDGRGCRG